MRLVLRIWRYGAQVLRSACSVQHFFVAAVPGLTAFFLFFVFLIPPTAPFCSVVQ